MTTTLRSSLTPHPLVCAAMVIALNTFGVAGATAATRDADNAAPASSPSATAPGSASSVPTLPADARDAKTFNLVVGVQQSIPVGKALSRVAVGDPDIADVMVMRGAHAGNLLLMAKAPGTTSLLVWTRDQTEPQRYLVKVISPATAVLTEAGGPTVSVAGGTTIVTGKAATVGAHERAIAAAKATAGKDGVIVDGSTIAASPVVQVDVKVVEFSRTMLKQLGINFQKTNNGFTYGISTPGSSPGSPPLSNAFTLIANSTTRGILGDISALEGDGLARILAEPTLVALSGQSANFLAGGEVPIPVPQGLGSTAIEYKPYGVGLTLTPTVLSANRIALKVAPEASDLDFQHAITIDGVSVPALTTRRADTTVELGDGESFIIGGLIDRETITNVNKVPLLGDLPIIGAFFKSLNYSQTDKELVIVVTPHLVSPLAKDAVIPLPGEKNEQRDGPVWRSYVGGMASKDALPGFSK